MQVYLVDWLKLIFGSVGPISIQPVWPNFNLYLLIGHNYGLSLFLILGSRNLLSQNDHPYRLGCGWGRRRWPIFKLPRWSREEGTVAGQAHLTLNQPPLLVFKATERGLQRRTGSLSLSGEGRLSTAPKWHLPCPPIGQQAGNWLLIGRASYQLMWERVSGAARRF